MCRKLIYLVSLVLVLSVAGSASAELAVHWKLDDGSGTTAIDSSGNGRNGTFVGTLEWVDGYYGGGVHFTAQGQMVRYEFEAEESWSAGTATMWVKADTVGQAVWRSLFASHLPKPGFQIDVDGEDPGNYRMNPGGTIGPVSTDWVHIAVAWESGSVNMYYNGNLANSGAIGANNTLFNVFALGISRSGEWTLMGVLDDFRAYDVALTAEEIAQAMIVAPPGMASEPSPGDETTDVPWDVVLSWTPGVYADKHDVYFGTVLDDVKDASRTDPRSVLLSQAQDANTYDPAGCLEFGQTCHWRIDEVNDVNPDSPWIGDVWSFTVESFAYPIAAENITATASSFNKIEEGPENTINGSGLDDNDLHSDDSKAMWLSSMIGPQPTWIQYEFDRVNKLHQMWVWNHNGSVEPVVGFGVRDATIEYSVDGVNWTTLGTTHEFARAPGVAGYAADPTIDLSGVVAKYVKITANNNWGGIVPQYGLSEVRFLYIPVRAREPSPDSGATDVDVEMVLSWRTGREAAQHDVYLGTDEQAVIDGNAPVVSVTETSYGPLSLDLAQTYYWKVNEVNMAETPTTLEGDVWNLTTRQFLVVDDFESYNDLDPDDPESNRIFLTWIDGFEQPANGSVVGYAAAPFAEQDIVHSGGQSMPLFYDNTGTARYSEAEVSLSPPQDWTKSSVAALSLWFSGDPNNVPDQMYVKINDSKVTYDGDAGNLTLRPWQPWNIDLASLGIDLQNVTKFSIGFGDETSMTPGGSGVVYVDDIRLYPYSRQLATPAEPAPGSLVARCRGAGHPVQ